MKNELFAKASMSRGGNLVRYWQYPQKWDALVLRTIQFQECLLVRFRSGLIQDALICRDKT